MGKLIHLKPIDVEVAAPREMVFQILSAIGNGQIPGSQGDSARVLSRDGNTIIAEFHTRAGRRTFVTEEEVTLYPPERITFRHLKGPLSYVWEEITLEARGAATVLRHRGEFSVNNWPVLGWLIGRLYVKPLFERVVSDHFNRIKEAAEGRAIRSHLFRPPSSTMAGDGPT